MAREGEPLSERELEVVQLVAMGSTNLQIARRLSISPHTVKVHLARIFAKLGVQSRTELAMRAVEEGWVTVGEAPERVEVERATTIAEAPQVSRRQLVWRATSILALTLAFLMILVLPLIYIQLRNRMERRALVAEAPNPADISAQASRWSELARMPTARSRLAVVTYGGQIYAIGGETTRGVCALVEIYDPVSDGWQTARRKPTAVRDVSAVTLGGKIYVPGGCTDEGKALSIVEVYDPRTGSWEVAASLPKPLCAYALATWEGNLYLFGGWGGSSYSAATYRYDPGVDIWQEGTPLSSARGYAGAATLGDKIYVVGGYDGQEILKTVEEYDPILETEGIDPWRSKAPMSVGRAGLGAAALGGSLYVVGGGWDQPIGYNEWYNPQEDTWTPFESPITEPWRQGSVAAIDTRLYLIGGWDSDYLDRAEAYQALYRIFLPAVP